MFDIRDHDASALEDALGAPTAGFFCAGEIGPVGGRNFLHGFTATMGGFPALAAGSWWRGGPGTPGGAVRGLVRPASDADLPDGVERAEGDLNDPDSLRDPLDGVSAVFLLSGY